MGSHSDAMQTRMLARGFAPRTRTAYLGWMRRLVRFSHTPADQLSEEQALEYVADLTRRGRSGSTVNQALGAIKFFYTEVVPFGAREKRASYARQKWAAVEARLNVSRFEVSVSGARRTCVPAAVAVDVGSVCRARAVARRRLRQLGREGRDG
jgi:hypothetical protein